MPVERIANTVRHLPGAFIAEDGTGITDDFRAYALPCSDRIHSPCMNELAPGWRNPVS